MGQNFFKNKKIFIYDARNIKKVVSNNNSELDYELIDNDFFNNKKLIFENIGDGYAMEYYSKIVFLLKIKNQATNIIPPDENQKIINIYNQYKKCLKVPLLVEIPNNYIFKHKLDKEIKKVLCDNVICEYQIISNLKRIESSVREELKNNFDETINKKYENVLCLNYLEYLKKTH